MKILDLIKMLVLTSVLVFSSQLHAAKATTTNSVDSKIVTTIKNKYAADAAISGLKINVKSKAGVVTLTGRAKNNDEASKLIQIAQSTDGVKNVNAKQLKVTESKTSTESKDSLADTVITAKVKGTFVREKLFGSNDVAVMSINVETTNGVVHLSGTVENKQQADNAIKLAKSVEGVQRVDSTLTVQAQ